MMRLDLSLCQNQRYQALLALWPNGHSEIVAGERITHPQQRLKPESVRFAANTLAARCGPGTEFRASNAIAPPDPDADTLAPVSEVEEITRQVRGLHKQYSVDETIHRARGVDCYYADVAGEKVVARAMGVTHPWTEAILARHPLFYPANPSGFIVLARSHGIREYNKPLERQNLNRAASQALQAYDMTWGSPGFSVRRYTGEAFDVFISEVSECDYEPTRYRAHDLYRGRMERLVEALKSNARNS